MCGRFARVGELRNWLAPLGLDAGRLGAPCPAGARYNIAPGTTTWLVTADAAGAPALAECLWSFPTSHGNRINVRSETADRVPEYREFYAHHRCAVLASGFYEPKGAKTLANRPWFFFQAPAAQPLYLGAILGRAGFSILTRAPVPPVSTVHDRAPVLVPVEHVLVWLDPEIPGRQALANLAPEAFAEGLEGWRVGDAAKRAGNEGPELIRRLD